MLNIHILEHKWGNKLETMKWKKKAREGTWD